MFAVLRMYELDNIMKTSFLSTLVLVGFSASASSVPMSNFNPDVSLVLDARLAFTENASDDYEIPGFMLGGEAGLAEQGFSLGHSELSFSSNIDDLYFGKLTLALAEHEGESNTEIEEAYIQTLALDDGLVLMAGRFLSGIGYQNAQHAHAQSFSDSPLVYSALFGNSLIEDGLQLTWLAPTDLFVQLGAEALSGKRYPSAGGANEGKGAFSFFGKMGGDLDDSNSWQLGLSYFESDVEGREAGGHSHSAEEASEVPSFTGISKVAGVDFVWKWAPLGNATNNNVVFQSEVFQREELGVVSMLGSDPMEKSTLKSTQVGWYAQLVHQFRPQWRWGVRYGRLTSDNTGSDEEVLEEAGLGDEGITPNRTSAMLQWSNSEFSRIRVQFNQDNSYEEKDRQLFLHYTMSLGAHGAHSF